MSMSKRVSKLLRRLKVSNESGGMKMIGTMLRKKKKELRNLKMNIWKFTVHALLKPSLENFEHYFTSV